MESRSISETIWRILLFLLVFSVIFLLLVFLSHVF